MSKIDDGGPAFPIPEAVDGVAPGFGGMSLRDYFAEKAMAACITAIGNGSGLPVVIDDERLAERSYEIADAMLAAREAGNPEQQPQGGIEWNGGECPVPEGVSFFVRFRDGDKFDVGTGEGLIWKHDGTIGDIIAYRIVSNGDQK